MPKKSHRLTVRFNKEEWAVVEELQKGAREFLGLECSKAEAVRLGLRIIRGLVQERAKKWGLEYLPVGCFFLSPKEWETKVEEWKKRRLLSARR